MWTRARSRALVLAWMEGRRHERRHREKNGGIWCSIGWKEMKGMRGMIMYTKIWGEGFSPPEKLFLGKEEIALYLSPCKVFQSAESSIKYFVQITVWGRHLTWSVLNQLLVLDTGTSQLTKTAKKKEKRKKKINSHLRAQFHNCKYWMILDRFL